jgi:hypothetical protein
MMVLHTYRWLIACFLTATLLHATGITISGNVSTQQTEPVHNALVTLINESDTTQTYSDVTDILGDFEITGIPLAVTSKIPLPESLDLQQNFPNPFNPSTILRFSVSQKSKISLKIYNILGQEVLSLAKGDFDPGSYEVQWDGRGNNGEYVSSGIYLSVLSDGQQRITRKMILLDSGSGISTSVVLSRRSKPLSLRKSTTPSFRMHVSNTDSTEPRITPYDRYQLTINGDTTINLVLQAANRAPSVSNVALTPDIPDSEDTLKLAYDYFDPDGDTDHSVKQWYKNDRFTGITGVVFPPHRTVAGDSIKAVVIPYDGELTGTPVESNLVVIQSGLYAPTIDSLTDIAINEDEAPASLIYDLRTRIHDQDHALDELLVQLEQSNPELLNLALSDSLTIDFDSLQTDGIGYSDISVWVTDPDMLTAVESFRFVVYSMPDIRGKLRRELTDEVIPIAGAVVLYGDVSDTTDSLGNYNIQVALGTSARLVFTHPEHYERQTSEFTAFVDTLLNETMVDTSFNIEHYDKITRSREQALRPGTQRWATVPRVYINTSPAENNGGDSTEVTQVMIDTALSVIGDLPQFAYNLFPGDTVEVETGTNPPWGTEDYIIFMWDNTIPGAGEHYERLDGNRIDYAVARAGTEAGRGTYLQELSQNLGGRNDSNIVQPSILNSPSAGYNYHPVDFLIGRLLYSRPIGTTSPDSDP